MSAKKVKTSAKKKQKQLVSPSSDASVWTACSGNWFVRTITCQPALPVLNTHKHKIRKQTKNIESSPFVDNNLDSITKNNDLESAAFTPIENENKEEPRSISPNLEVNKSDYNSNIINNDNNDSIANNGSKEITNEFQNDEATINSINTDSMSSLTSPIQSTTQENHISEVSEDASNPSDENNALNDVKISDGFNFFDLNEHLTQDEIISSNESKSDHPILEDIKISDSSEVKQQKLSPPHEDKISDDKMPNIVPILGMQSETKKKEPDFVTKRREAEDLAAKKMKEADAKMRADRELIEKQNAEAEDAFLFQAQKSADLKALREQQRASEFYVEGRLVNDVLLFHHYRIIQKFMSRRISKPISLNKMILLPFFILFYPLFLPAVILSAIFSSSHLDSLFQLTRVIRYKNRLIYEISVFILILAFLISTIYIIFPGLLTIYLTNYIVEYSLPLICIGFGIYFFLLFIVILWVLVLSWKDKFLSSQIHPLFMDPTESSINASEDLEISQQPEQAKTLNSIRDLNTSKYSLPGFVFLFSIFLEIIQLLDLSLFFPSIYENSGLNPSILLRKFVGLFLLDIDGIPFSIHLIIFIIVCILALAWIFISAFIYFNLVFDRLDLIPKSDTLIFILSQSLFLFIVFSLSKWVHCTYSYYAYLSMFEVYSSENQPMTFCWTGDHFIIAFILLYILSSYILSVFFIGSLFSVNLDLPSLGMLSQTYFLVNRAAKLLLVANVLLFTPDHPIIASSIGIFLSVIVFSLFIKKVPVLTDQNFDFWYFFERLGWLIICWCNICNLWQSLWVGIDPIVNMSEPMEYYGGIIFLVGIISLIVFTFIEVLLRFLTHKSEPRTRSRTRSSSNASRKPIQNSPKTIPSDNKVNSSNQIELMPKKAPVNINIIRPGADAKQGHYPKGLF